MQIAERKDRFDGNGIGQTAPSDRVDNAYLRAPLTFVTIIVALYLIIPNYFLFSPDDMWFAVRKKPLIDLANSFAWDGRFTTWGVLRILNAAHVDYASFIAVSGVLFLVSMFYLIYECGIFLKIESIWARLFGALFFCTFSLNLDMYQFKTAYLTFALSFGAGGLAFRIARTNYPFVVRVILASICLALALGAYQIILQVIVMVIAVWALSRAMEWQSASTDRAPLTLLSASGVAAILYLTVNGGLKRMAVQGFVHYPHRAPSVKFIPKNLEAYLGTLFDLLSPAHSRFSPMTNFFTSTALLFLCVVALWVFCARARGWKKWAIPIVFAGALLCAPDPANILLKNYFPSPRSVVGTAFFFAGILSLLIDVAAVAPDSVSAPKRAFAAFAALLVLTQIVNDSELFARRSIQQTLDMALARQIVAEIERLSPSSGHPIAAKIVTPWYSSDVYKKTPYAYGVSLFGTDYTPGPLLTFVSGGRVVGRAGAQSDCAKSTARTAPVVTVGADGVALVCFPSRRVALLRSL